MNYRRAKINGATYFFTVVTHDRKPFLCHPENVKLLRQALRSTMERHPIEIDAFVLLPDHLHTIPMAANQKLLHPSLPNHI